MFGEILNNLVQFVGIAFLCVILVCIFMLMVAIVRVTWTSISTTVQKMRDGKLDDSKEKR